MYVVSHKEINNNFPEGYKTIIVNANKTEVKGDIYDNTGDNISFKNDSYCELTAIYWLWKNSLDDYIGINHYRRFFVDNNNLLTDKKARKITNDGTIILPKKESFHKKMGFMYWSTSGYKSDLRVIQRSIAKLYPDYCNDFDRFLKCKQMYCYNMMIMNRSLFNDYCQWLFAILTDVENSLNQEKRGAQNRKGYYKRIYGFMAERLLNVYVMHNNINIVELPIKFVGGRPNLSNRISNKLKKMKDKYIG